MILKQLRISRHLSQEQLAQMSGLNVRTIQRIENGQNASVESLKCLAAVLEVTVETLNQERMMIDKNTEQYRQLPLWVKWWFFFNYGTFKPSRKATVRAMILCHLSGFIFCVGGLFIDPLKGGAVCMLFTAYFCTFLKWQGDKFGVWFDVVDVAK